MKGTILVIEDETAICDLICMNLEAAGYETVSFSRGDDAQRELQTDNAYDLALLDVMLPGKDGFELLPVLREKRFRSFF